MINKNDIKFLKQYEDRFRTALNSNYVRNIPSSDVERMTLIYYNVTGNKLGYVANCGSCILSICKSVGRLYFSQVNNNEKKDDKQ